MRRKIVLSLTLVFLSLFIGFFSVKGNTNKTVRNRSGVSIRKKTEKSQQGLRFTAEIDEEIKKHEHGFYVVYGETSVNELKEAINNSSSTIYLNDKKVFQVEVIGVNKNNDYSVILIGIPESGYFDNFSVFPYVLINEEIKLSSEPNKRSVADVALNMANQGKEIADLVAVNSITQTNKKKVNFKANGDIVISKGVYELDHQALKNEFIKDWNNLFNDSIDLNNANKFFLHAKTGSLTTNNKNKDLSSTNLYKFFNNKTLKHKWSWLLDYLINECDVLFPSQQANAIKNNGTYNDAFLFNGAHLSCSIVNFFNQDNDDSEYIGINFNNYARYERIKDFNKSLFVNLKDSKLYNDGEEIRLPAPKDKLGRRFNGYKKGSKTFNPGEAYIIDGEDVIEADYNLIAYSMSFYDGENIINSLKRTYNIDDEFTLPVYEKEGYKFLGWYKNANLNGKAIKTLKKGNINELKLYGKWEKIDENTPQPDKEYIVTFDSKGGTSISPITVLENKAVNKPNNPTKEGFTFLGWYLNNIKYNFSNKVTKNITLIAKWNKVETPEPDKEYTVTFDSKGGTSITPIKVTEGNKVTKPNNPTKTGYKFIEWQLNSNTFSFNTKINSNLTLNAKWEKVEPVDPNKEYTIIFNLNGGSWPTTGGSQTYANRDEMVIDFLTDFYNFVSPSGLSLNDFIHGSGKTSGFDGTYSDYVEDLRALNDKTVNPSTNKFVNQQKYNKWVALIDLMDEYTGFNPEQKGQFWSSNWTAGLRFKPFVQKKNLFGEGLADEVNAVLNNIPSSLQGGSSGIPIEVPNKYKVTDKDILLPTPEKSNDPFIGWYDNSDYLGNKITKIVKGSTGNKVFYARYNSTEVPEVPLTDAEKLALAKSDLKLGFSSGDSLNSVTKDLTLKTSGLHGATISWASSDASTVNTSGKVVRIESGDVKVTLTATIKLKDLTETKTFKVTVKKEVTTFTITYNLNGGKFDGYKNKTEIATAFLKDLYDFVGPSESLNDFMHGSGKTSGFNGAWYSNEDYRAKIFKAATKTGDNAYFLSSSTYQSKWKAFTDFMIDFVKVGNAEQDFWASPYTGNMRIWQYFRDVKPSEAWTDEDMAKTPSGLSATVTYEYDKNSPTIKLPKVKRSGYTFMGWYKEADFSESKVTEIKKGSTGNKTYYAKWSQPVYTITLNTNGGKIGKFSKTDLAKAFLNDLYSFIQPSESLDTFRHGAGKTSGFNGTWYSNEEHRAKIYQAGVKSGNNDYFLSSSLYQAKWKPFTTFMNTFVKVGNPDQDFWSSPYTGNMRISQYFRNVKPGPAWEDADMKKTPGTITPKKYAGGSRGIILPKATRSGYSFTGWYTAKTGGSKVSLISRNSTGNKTYYARWTKTEFKITYVLGGGSLSGSYPKTYKKGTTTKLPIPKRTGYTFSGWYTASSGGSKVTSISSSASGDKKYYARWKKTDNKGKRILAFGRTKVGGPYVWGGNGPRGYDCSGLTKAAYAHVGISIPRVANEQYRQSRRISRSEARPGDLVFWHNGSRVYHVGIWVGSGTKVVEAANTRVGIVERNLWRGSGDTHYYGTFW